MNTVFQQNNPNLYLPTYFITKIVLASNNMYNTQEKVNQAGRLANTIIITFVSVQTAKTEWKKLRDNHRDALKRAKLGKNKLLPAQITTWKYAKVMQFLEPHMKYRITENIEMDPPAGVSSKTSDHDVTTTEMPETCESPNPKRRCVDRNGESPVKIRQDNAALESFFNCVLQSTKEMPPWMQTQVKKKIFAVIIDAEEHLSTQEQSDFRETYESNCNIETTIKSEVFTEDSSDVTY